VLFHQPSSEIFIPQALPLQEESQVLDSSASAPRKQGSPIQVFQRPLAEKRDSPPKEDKKYLNIFSDIEKRYMNFKPPKFQNTSADIVPS